ncbi:MAG: uracil-DNA glycosylase [Burkholderiaceae bacterium]
MFDAEPASDAARLGAWQPQTWPVAADWQALVDAFCGSAPGMQLGQFVQQRLAAGARVYPPQPLRALALTALREVRVVILGQDPYHGTGQAEGLAFSVARGVKLPPSLRNIFKERQRDLGLPIPSHGSLQAWAAQGVLLLNTTLTVEDGLPASHAKHGWEVLTDAIIQTCAQKTSPVVFMLWGGHAQAKQALIAAHNLDARHLVLQANHPSPLSALRPPTPFIGCGHLGAARRWLASTEPQTTQGLFA